MLACLLQPYSEKPLKASDFYAPEEQPRGPTDADVAAFNQAVGLPIPPQSGGKIGPPPEGWMAITEKPNG